MKRLFLCTVWLAASLPWNAIQAREDPDEPPPRKLTIRPTAAPVPALRYRLLPESRELLPGNAALFYHRAIEDQIEVRLRRTIQAQSEKKTPAQISAEDQKLQAELNQPLASFPKEMIRGYLERYANCLREIELGARRESCDWGFRNRDEGIALNLSDIQETRSLGRLVVLKLRLELAEGRIDSAIHWLRTGLALGRHVGQATTLIQSLVASSIISQMMDPLEELIQLPGAPNLYWALANLPRPFLDISESLEVERHMLEKEIPILKTLASAPWSVEQAREFADELKQKYTLLTGEGPFVSSSTARPDMKDLSQHVLFTSVVARAYPTAKRELIARGMPASKVEAMPTIQVVALHSYRLYEEARDDIFKWAGLPFVQGHEGMRRADENPRLGWNTLKSGIPFALVLPNIRSVYVVPVRVDRRLDVIQAIEAIRLYTAGHEGKLPPSLEAITEAPAPLDLATGKPFGYRVDGDKATLNAPPPPGWNIPQFKVHYELTLSR